MSTGSINVHIGEVKIGRGTQELHTILGSCIGIALLWPGRNTFGLAHCLLPKSPNQNYEEGGRYVDQAIETLLQRMSVTNSRDIRAVVAGGANMTRPDTDAPERLVGFQNAQSALSNLDKRDIIVVHEDTGGFSGRKMSICCETGTFEVKQIPRINA